MRRILGYILFLLCPLFVWADGSMWWNTDYNTTEGTEFLVTYMNNSVSDIADYADLSLHLYAAARKTAHLTITGIYIDPETKNRSTYYRSITIQGGTVDTIQIPNPVAYLQSSNQPEDDEWLSKGIVIKSDLPISLYSLNSTLHTTNQSYDASLILPTSNLYKEYIIQTLTQDKGATEFAIVSAKDNNEVDINLVETKLNETPQHSKFTVTLNRGETYLYRSSEASVSLTGSHVCATQPIAIFQGGQEAIIPMNSRISGSHIYEQAFPTDLWGKHYCVTRTFLQQKDLIRITAASPSTMVYKEGRLVATLNALETYEETITWQEDQKAIIYETSAATECFLYSTSYNANSTDYGSPASTSITPTEQGINSIIVAPFDETRVKELGLDSAIYAGPLKEYYWHFVNIVVKTSNVRGMKLDGADISSQFSPIAASDYSVAIVKISTGSHIIENQLGTFTSRIYGIFADDGTKTGINYTLSYACSGGSNTHHNAYFLIDGQRIKDKTICVNHPPLTFTSVISYDYDKVYWLFDDIGITTPKVQNSRGDSIVTRSYTTQGIDNVCMVVERITPLCQNVIRDTIRATIRVKDTYQSTFSARACKGEMVSVIGRDIQGKQYTINYTTDVDADSLFYTIDGCDSIVHIDIKFGEPKNTDISATACGQYTWHGTTYKESGIYQWVGKTAYGCDSIVNLNLTINQPVNGPIEQKTICEKSSLSWNGLTITEAGTYHATLQAQNGCDSLCTVEVTIEKLVTETTNATICNEDSFEWRGKTYYQSDTITEISPSPCGCDSTLILQLVVLPKYDDTIPAWICEEDSIFFVDTYYRHEGIYTHHLKSAIQGCDSMVTLDLHIYPNEDSVRYDTTCSNHPYLFEGKELTQSGIYTMKQNTAQGCEQLITLHLVVYQAYDSLLRDTICAGETYYWEGGAYTKAGIYHKDYKTIHGCDSIMRLELTVNDTFHTYIDTTWCSNNDIYYHPDERATKLQNLTETGTYIDTIPTTHGCDSILTLNLKVIAVADTTIYDTICSTDSIKFGDEYIKQAGPHTREEVIESVCSRTVTLQLVVYPAYDITTRDTICAGDTCYWKGRKLTKSGTYDTTYQTIHGCDSIIKLELTVMPSYDNPTVYDEWCAEDGPYNYFDKRADKFQGLTKTGEYKDTLQTIYGCDSIITLDLKVWPNYVLSDTTRVSICDNEPYPFQGIIYNQHGEWKTADHSIRYDTLIGSGKSIHGCDSSFVHIVTTYPTYDSLMRDTICAGEIYSWEGNTYTTTGFYHKDYKTIHGCDSIMKLELTVNDTFNIPLRVERCSKEGPYNHPDSQADKLQNLSLSGIYRDTLQSVYGCDSILVLDLSIYPNEDSIIYDTTCSNHPYLFDEKELTQSGIYTMKQNTAQGCEQLITLHLVVYQAYDSLLRDTICAGETYYWEGGAYTKAGIYHKDYKTIHSCDSVMKLELTVMPTYEDPVVYDEWCAEDGPYNYFDKRADKFQGLTKTGEYKDTLQTIYGCDSIITLDLKVWPNYVLSDTTRVSICDNEPYPFQGIIYNQHGEWKTADHSIRQDTLFGSGKSIHGCDSSFVHIVTTYPTYEFVSTQQICSGDTVYWEGHTLTQTNIYEELKQTIYGCDSLLVLNLYAKPVVRKKRYLSGCEDTVFTHYDTIRNGSREVIMPTTLWNPYTNPQDVILHKEHTELVDVSFPSKDGTCDSIVYEYHIHLFPTYIDEKEATFCSNEMYPINSVHKVGIDTLFDYRDNVAPIDTTYRDTLQTITGCDSVFVLKAHILPASIHKQQDSICFGEELNWCEQIIQKGSGEYQYPNAGDYIFRYTYEKENGCDSIIELHLTVMPTYIDSIYQEWCSKDGAYNYPCAQALKLQELTETGVYRDTLLAISGCDSILVVNLHIFNNEDIEMYDTICSNDHYEFDNTLLTQSGIYQKTELLPNGCPQTTILNLTVYPAYEDTTEVTICYGDTCFWEDSTYTIEGEYIEHKYTIHGCDSILHLLLFIEPDYNTYTTDSICQGEQYLFDDEWINESGDYVHAHNSILGCDSSHYMTLIVFDTVATFDTTTICNNEPYDFYGQTITEEGTYRKSSLTEHGCSLNNYLTVYVIPPTIAHVSVEPLCADQKAFEVDFTYEGTQPIAYSLLYDSIGHSQGFVDIRHQLLESDSVIVVATPFRDDDTTKYPRPDHYPITLILHNGICQNDSLYPSQTDIIMNYPSWVTEQRFGDLIAILNEKYNGGYTFDKYQWYENGQMMIGETRPYLYLPHKLELVEYYVELTRTGETESFQTCPILIVPDQLDTIAPRLPYISVTPTYISSENPKANILSWTPGRYVITDVMGNRLMEGNYTPDSHNAYEIDVPSTPNVYIIYMEETDAGIYSQIPHEKNRSQKIIVY